MVIVLKLEKNHKSIYFKTAEFEQTATMKERMTEIFNIREQRKENAHNNPNNREKSLLRNEF